MILINFIDFINIIDILKVCDDFSFFGMFIIKLYY